MSPNVLLALTDLWNCAANTHNRRILSPWLSVTGPNRFHVYELASQYPVYELDEVRHLDDDTPIFEGRIRDRWAAPENREKVYTVGTPEAFFKIVAEHIASTKYRIQLTVEEHCEFLQYLRDTLPEAIFTQLAMCSCWKSYAARPFVGRTLSSLSESEAALLPDNLTLYCLRNQGGLWWKTLGTDKPVTLAALQKDSYEGSKRITGYTVP